MTSSSRDRIPRGRVKFLKKQLLDVDLWRSAVAEFLATFLFMLILYLTYMIPERSSGNTAANERHLESGSISQSSSTRGNSIESSVTIAFTYASLIQCFEDISGGYMNPAISLAMMIAGHIGVVRAIVYSLAQTAGAFSAVAVCFGVMSTSYEHMQTVSRVNDNLTALHAFGIEILLSCVITLTWLTTYVTSKTNLGSSAIPVGIAYLANYMWSGRLTDVSMNPARSLAPAALTQSWKNVWVFIAGPFAGSFIGSFLFLLLSSSKRKAATETASKTNAEESIEEDSEFSPLQTYPQASSPSSVKHVEDQSRDCRPIVDRHVINRKPTASIDPTIRSTNSMQRTSSSVPNLNKIHYCSSLNRNAFSPGLVLSPPSVSQALEAIQQTATSNRTSSANATLARGSCNAQYRPNTACSVMLNTNGAKQPALNSYVPDQTQTAILSRRNTSSCEPFPECTIALINDATL